MAMQHFKPPHPGELIYRTYIEPFESVSALRIAMKMRVHRSTFSCLIAGKADITPEMTIRLSAVLGRTPESWLLLQDSYGLFKARSAVDTSQISDRLRLDGVIGGLLESW